MDRFNQRRINTRAGNFHSQTAVHYAPRTLSRASASKPVQAGDGNDAPLAGENNAACSRRLTKLEQVDFALQELALYLDAYPQNREALDLFRQLTQERQRIVSAYVPSCGALTYRDVDTQNWSWVRGPWPWEARFSGNNPLEIENDDTESADTANRSSERR